jgi:hypothetical protein
MKPSELKADDFSRYRPLARKTAVQYLAILQQLPPAFLPFLLKEIISLDWKFPAERDEVLSQLSYLQALSPAEREREMETFSHLRLTPELDGFDAVNLPSQCLEKLSAHLWASSQMDAFRTASELYMKNFRTARPEQAPLLPRLGIVLFGSGVTLNDYPLFRKLRREGTYFGKVDGAHGLEQIMQLVESRASAQVIPYGHWFVDGSHTPASGRQIVFISYQDLSGIRTALTARIRQAFESRMPPEALRTMLAEITPADVMPNSRGDEALDRFKVNLFTEGAGTQIYSTTFVQWAAREALRRAKPVTLVARFTPRQREAPMSELLNGTFKDRTDAAGSLVDGDMGAWYTWISLQRLTGADQSSFLAWFEGHNEAVGVGPAFAKGTQENNPIELAELLKKIAATTPPARI